MSGNAIATSDNTSAGGIKALTQKLVKIATRLLFLRVSVVMTPIFMSSVNRSGNSNTNPSNADVMNISDRN